MDASSLGKSRGVLSVGTRRLGDGESSPESWASSTKRDDRTRRYCRCLVLGMVSGDDGEGKVLSKYMGTPWDGTWNADNTTKPSYLGGCTLVIPHSANAETDFHSWHLVKGKGGYPREVVPCQGPFGTTYASQTV